MRLPYKTGLFLLLLFALTLQGRAQSGTDEERIFRTITASDGIADNSAQTIKCTRTGRMTITTIGNINFYDGANFSHVDTKNELKYRLEDYHGHYHIYFDNNHHLWLKSTNGVSCVNLTTETYISNVDSVFATYGAKGRVNDMFVDISGDVWLCLDNYIFSQKYNKKIPLRFGLNLQDVEVIDKTYLMLFYNNGLLACYNLATGRQFYQNYAYSADMAKLYDRSCVQLMHDGSFYLIRNGEGGAVLLRYNLARREWSVLMQSEFHLNNMVVHDGKLYIASAQGYFTYRFTTGEIVHHKLLTLQNGRELWTDVNTIEFDLQGGMWIGTEMRGLLYDSPMDASFHTLSWEDPKAKEYWAMMSDKVGIFEFKGRKANAMFIDSRHWTWVATPNGLYLYTSPQVEPTVFNTKNGLLNNVVHAIVEDDMHNIWVSTSYGISCVHLVNDKVKRVYSFNHYDNVPNETFINAKAIKLPGGEIVMQALDHVVTFNPSGFENFFNQEASVMRPKLTRLMVNGIDVSVGDTVNNSVVLDRAISRTKEINLNYDQNSITLTFSALNYARPLETHYKVRVRELNPEWREYSYFGANGLVDRKGLLHLPMLALEPGTYHIELLASMVPGQYVGEVYEWVVNVNQPWWRTTGVMAVFALIVIALAVVNFIVYNRNTRLRMKRNNEEGDVIRRINAFVERCDTYSKEKLSPTQEEIYGTDSESYVELNSDFVDAMLKVIPFIHERNSRPYSMNMLSKAADMELLEFYEMVSENIHKSPRALICTMRIDQAAEMLRTTDKTVEQIAIDCGFVSPNYLIAKFYHQFRMTPDEYREEFVQ